MKIVKKAMILVLCFLLAVPAVSVSAVDVEKGADAKVYADVTGVKVGETFTVTVYLENLTIPDGAIGCDIPVQYNGDVLELVDRECIFPDCWDRFGVSMYTEVIKPEENPYWLRCVCNSKDLLINTKRNVKEDKELGFKLTFKAKKTGAATIQTVSKVGNLNAYVVNADKSVTNYGLGADKLNIAVTVGGGDIGDVSGDGYVDSFDAYLVLSADAMLRTLTDDQKALADSDGSGTVTPFDASLMLRYDAGLISRF